MLYEYRHVGRRKRGCPETFELRRNVAKRDADAPCPKCGTLETERLKFQAFAFPSRFDADAARAPKPPGSGPYDDHTPANMPDDLDSDVAHL